jgi:hypothetical protein
MRLDMYRTTGLRTKTLLSFTCYPTVTPELTLHKSRIPQLNIRPGASHTTRTTSSPTLGLYPEENVREPGPTFGPNY